MKKSTLTFALYFLFLLLVASAGQRSLINGRWWGNLDEKGKRNAYMVYMAAFMEGAREGIVFEKFRASDKTLNRDEMLNDPFFGEVDSSLRRNMAPSMGGEFDVNAMIRIIDRFYKEPLNTNISLYGALLYSSNELRGTDRKSLDEILQNLRKDNSY